MSKFWVPSPELKKHMDDMASGKIVPGVPLSKREMAFYRVSDMGRGVVGRHPVELNKSGCGRNDG